MSLLDQLWEKGPGKLQKQSTFSFQSSDSSKAAAAAVNTEPAMRVTRSITIVKPLRTENETPPAESTPPVSPFPGGRSEAFGFRRRSTSDTFEKATGIGFRSPRAPYDL